MNGEGEVDAAREFCFQVGHLYEKVFPDGVERPLTLSEAESLDITQLLESQKLMDQTGPESLAALPMPDLLVLAHRIDALVRCLSSFGKEDGPLARRIYALTGQGPHGAYRRASQESSALFGQNKLGQA